METENLQEKKEVEVEKKEVPQEKSNMKSKLPFIIIALLLLLVGALGTYFVMTQMNVNKTEPSPSPTQVVDETEELSSPSPEASAENEVELTQSFSSSKFSDLSFSGYSIKYPEDWTLKEERDNSVPISTVTISKQGYSLKIFQGATGGAGCIYEGDMPEGPASDYRTNKYVDLASFATLRQTESPANGKMAYAYCQKNTSDGSFGQPTSVGHMNATTGVSNPDEEIILELEEIVKSIKTL